MRRAQDWAMLIVVISLIVLVAAGRADVDELLKFCAGVPK